MEVKMKNNFCGLAQHLLLIYLTSIRIIESKNGSEQEIVAKKGI